VFGYATFSESPYASLATSTYFSEVSEVASASEVVSSLQNNSVTIAETLAANDAFFSIFFGNANIQEEIIASIENSAFVSVLSFAEETATLSDLPVCQTEFITSLSESITTANQVSSAATFSTRTEDSSIGLEEISSAFDVFALVQEQSSSSEQIFSNSAVRVFVQETSVGTDQAFALAVNLASVSELATSFGAFSSALSASANLSETSSGSETLEAVVPIFRTVEDSAVGTDNVFSLPELKATVSEVLSILGVTDSNVALSSRISENILALSQQNAAATFNGILRERISGSEGIFVLVRVDTTVNEEAVATTLIFGRSLWEPVDDSQDSTWQAVDDSQASTWQIVNDSQNSSWTII